MASSMDHKEYTEHVRYKCLLSMLSMSDDIKALPFFFSMDDSSYSSLPSLEGDGGLAYVEVNGLNAGRGSC
jgi:hypothetical protein